MGHSAHRSRSPAHLLSRTLARWAAIRDLDGGSYLETFLVSAVATLLLTRLYLELTDYPRIGSGAFHIAHVLWGGALMLLSQVMLLGFLGKQVKRAASVVGGAGFGMFIDELGKFITSDSNYFYRPTAALIYVIFIGLFLLFRWIERRRHHSRVELLVNSADMLKEVIIDGASSAEIKRALTILEQSGDRSELAQALRRAIHDAERSPEQSPTLPARLATFARQIYESFVLQRWFHRVVLLAFATNAAVGIVVMLSVLLVSQLNPFLDDDRSFTTLALACAVTAVWILTVVGVIRLRHSRLAAYRWFKRSVLTTILIVQVFLFVMNQPLALLGLSINLLLLIGINGMIRAEYDRLGTELQPMSEESRRTR